MILEEPSNNPYDNITEDEYVTIKLKSLAQISCGCAAAAVTDDPIKVMQILSEYWEDYLPVIRNMLWEMDQEEMRGVAERGELQ